jgi:hypothetical protein
MSGGNWREMASDSTQARPIQEDAPVTSSVEYFMTQPGVSNCATYLQARLRFEKDSPYTGRLA